MTYADKVASCLRDAARLDEFLPDVRRATVINAVGGQSGAQGGHGVNPDAIQFTSGTAYSADADTSVRTLREMTINTGGTGTDRIGSASPIYGFAAQMWEVHGLRTVNAMLAWQGTAVLDATPNGINPAYRWASASPELSLLESSQALGVQIRNQIIPQLLQCVQLRPELKVRFKVFHWCQGEAEAPHLLSGAITKAQYQQGLQTVWDAVRAQGFDVMVVYEHGRKGLQDTPDSDPDSILSNEPMNILVREAQADFVSANPDVIWGAQAAKETGPLVVSGSGVWISGFTYATDDGGVHGTAAAHTAAGRYAADNVVQHFTPPSMG